MVLLAPLLSLECWCFLPLFSGGAAFPSCLWRWCCCPTASSSCAVTKNNQTFLHVRVIIYDSNLQHKQTGHFSKGEGESSNQQELNGERVEFFCRAVWVAAVVGLASSSVAACVHLFEFFHRVLSGELGLSGFLTVWHWSCDLVCLDVLQRRLRPEAIKKTKITKLKASPPKEAAHPKGAN